MKKVSIFIAITCILAVLSFLINQETNNPTQAEEKKNLNRYNELEEVIIKSSEKILTIKYKILSEKPI